MRGRRFKDTGLWRIPLNKAVKNEDTYTLLINRPDPKKEINNVYGLESTQETIRYFYTGAGLPTKETWIKVIRNG